MSKHRGSHDKSKGKGRGIHPLHGKKNWQEGFQKLKKDHGAACCKAGIFKGVCCSRVSIVTDIADVNAAEAVWDQVGIQDAPGQIAKDDIKQISHNVFTFFSMKSTISAAAEGFAKCLCVLIMAFRRSILLTSVMPWEICVYT